MGRIFLIMFLCLAVGGAHAQPTPPSPAVNQEQSGGIQQELTAIWTKLKNRVVSFFAQFQKDEDRAPASNAPVPTQSVPEQAPVPSVAIAPALPLDTTVHFSAPVKGSSKQEMQQVANTIKSQPVVTVAKPARAPVTQIPLNKHGVPVFELSKVVTKKSKNGKEKKETVRVVTNIPLLDLGEEAKLSAQGFTLPEISIMRVEYKKYGELSSPEVKSKKDLDQMLGPKVVAAGDAIKIQRTGDSENIGVVTLKKVQEIAYSLAAESGIDVKAIKDMDDDDLKFIRGLMLYVAGDRCHYAGGIFFEVGSSKKEALRDSARFYLADCLQKMGLFSQAAENIFEVLASNISIEMKSKAMALLTEFPENYNIEVGQKLEKYMDTNIPLKPEQRAHAAYMVAASAVRKENFNTAKRFAEMLPEGHNYYIRGQFIVAISEYQLGKAKAGLDRLKKLQTLLPKEPIHRDLHALISLNLARMAFQEKQFSEAAKYYLAIEKDHPLWITGLTEHAWNQLMAGDNEGAIGNMFSLQSTYLKAVYRPESFIVRTIGYLNLCQFADAYKSLTLLEREYRPWITRIDQFKKLTPKPVDYYKTMIRYLTSPSATDVGGLPYQALREIGRHKDFLNIQESINTKIDEGEQYKFIDSVAVKDFEKGKRLRALATARLGEIEAELKLIANGKKTPKDENQLKMNRNNERNNIEFYDFQLSVFKEATTGFKKLRDVGRNQLLREKERLATKAGETLKKRLELIQKDLNRYFENNEFLRYEVFAGSGENIRYHMAGGDSDKKRLPPSVKPENKELNWDFQGEFWEDEIGHYKTTLKDNCPQRAAASKN